jgi:hypothetical protein
MLNSDANRHEEHLEKLALVHALCQAIAAAISAIEKNDLQQFKAQVALQETICHRLSANHTLPKQDTLNVGAPDARLRREIVVAHTKLAQLNRVYAALLKRSSQTVGTIISLYRSNGEGYNRGPVHLPQCRSWSCEV